MDARTTHRIGAISALGAAYSAVVLIGAGVVGAGGRAPVDAALRPLGAADVRLAGEIRALRPAAPTKPAVEAARAADAAGDRALRLLAGSDDSAGEQAREAVERHQELIDAVGSTLANPSSPLRDKLIGRADATRRAFERLGLDSVGHAGRLPAGQLAAFSRRRAAG